MKTALALMGATIGLTFLPMTAGAQLKPTAVVIPQADSPVAIAGYEAQYQEESRYASEGIRHSLRYTNNSQKTIVAVQFGLVSFSIWNEFLDQTLGLSRTTIQPGKEDRGEWLARRLADFSFLSGVAYVSRVRFADGEIWSADLTAIAQDLRTIEKDFDASALDPRKKQPQ